MVQVLQYFLLIIFIFNNEEVFCKKNFSKHSKFENGKIIGGHNVTIKEVPYQVYLLLKNQGTNVYVACGGSIINARTVLTAAHCVGGREWVQVRIGSAVSNSGGKTYISRTFVTHPQWNPKTTDWDVGIIKLDQDMDLDGSTARAVKLSESGPIPQPGTEVLTSGWGLTSDGGSTSRYVMAVRVPVVSYEDCRKSYTYISSRMMCAGEGGRNFCNGDSGGPAVSQMTGAQVGIVSFYANGCSNPRFPGVYANVAEPSIRNFIRLNSGI